MKKRKWSEEQLKIFANQVTSIRQLLIKLGLREAGGNYSQIKKFLRLYNIDHSHFTGKGWNKGLNIIRRIPKPIKEILTDDSSYQSYKLKNRLFAEGFKVPKCELCGWNKKTEDGRMPLELDHINGKHTDNRIENLRILCPNCHSLQPTHRGRNRKRKK
jgi:hypothetical protein